MSKNKATSSTNLNNSRITSDLEDGITNCWGIVDEIRLLNSAVQDKDLDRDSIANVLLGLEYLYELKFQKLMDSYSELLQNQIKK